MGRRTERDKSTPPRGRSRVDGRPAAGDPEPTPDDHLDEVRRFYDSLAPDYDLMTSFDARFAKERPWFGAIVNRFNIRTALDAGCGTGFHSILLSQLGVAVTGIDVSATMAELAGQNARRLGAPVTVAHGAFSDLSRISPGPFDAVFCLGNSLVHLLTGAELNDALSNFRSVLRPGGVLIAQILNYHRILAEKKELLGRREAGGMAFERKYAYRGDTVTFTISRGGKSDSVTLRPLTDAMLGMACAAEGFTGIESFGSLTLDEYDPGRSGDLVLIAGAGKRP